MIFTIVSCIAIKAQDVLEITGPIDALEGEVVEFNVTLNGEPVQARVTFGDLTPAKYSDRVTGKVEFTMPLVSLGGEEYVITASIPGDLYSYHTILVKNATKNLEITLSTDYVNELDEFVVSITAEDEPIADTTVWFNSQTHITDYNGYVNLTAPDVLVTTNYGISAKKTGYTSNSVMVMIHEANAGVKLMELIAPSIVEPGQENIEVSVINKNGGLDDVIIELFYEGEKLNEYTTDDNGKAYINVPFMNHDNYFSLYLTKEEYDTYGTDKEFEIILFESYFDQDLGINIIPSEVYENEEVTVEVIDDVGVGVEGAIIWRGNIELIDLTDSEGISSFIAPSVFMDRQYYIYAIKEGYNFAEKTITVRDRNVDQEELTIISDTLVNDSELFYITIKGSDNLPLQDVKVTFNFEEKLTDEDGIVSFVAPNVTSDSFYSIDASKYGFLPASTSIEVINLDSSNGSSSKKLTVCVAPHAFENEEFTITIRNEQGNTVSDARVKFLDIFYYTDFKGSVTVTAPDVSWDTTHEIIVTKSGYDSSPAEIIVKNSEVFQYWYLVVAIVVILIIGIVAYFRYGPII